jgi:hypothetical protein
MAAGLFSASFLTQTSPLWAAGLALLVIGSGMAVFQTPNTSAIMSATPRTHAGVGSAFIAEARNVGMAVGIAVTAAIVGVSMGSAGLPGGAGKLEPTVAALFLEGMSAALRVGALVALCAAALSWFRTSPDSVEGGGGKP